ncbi:GNAT family N-acetyltransferase [Paenibacillus sp. VCA1]|uniref:GNAT family N-acetyltransferase n=1 Tax=Paenibacillus sp. VCA1 TaxID=3039148 RepID=UPI002871BAA9|nr:GNAT family N-acetyltransferase [Paenibacillus sp. VCA1]MDR9854231.1 GNAT family N-acetyltransferase [Paenibacillus sp. VCA1]
MEIRLEAVSAENWYACTGLKVKTEQLNVFPAPVVYWIAESKFMDHFELRAINANGSLVGFIVFCPEPDEEGNCWIPAFMIDERHQGKGYGKAALKKLLEHMRAINCKRVMIGHRPENLVAANLYESLGFMKVTEEIVDGEIIRLLQFA